MKPLFFLVGMIVVLAIDARNVHDSPTEPSSDTGEDMFLQQNTDHAASQRRHGRRRPRQSSYYYDSYYRPHFPTNAHRREDRTEELLSMILSRLDEIALHLRSPPPPPQPSPPVYIPIPYPAPQFSVLPANITFRGPWEPQQNWGPVYNPPEVTDEEGDGSRPIYIKPKETTRPVRKPTKVKTKCESEPESKDEEPGPCQAAILSCCVLKDKAQCFENYGCTATFQTGVACKPEVIQSVIDEFVEKYGPQE